MPNMMEMRSAQKTLLFDLLLLKKDVKDNPRLNEMISRTEAGMEEEDVAWVEKMVAKKVK